MLILAAHSAALADFTCRVDVAYRWKKAETGQVTGPGAASPEPASDATPPAGDSSVQPAGGELVFWRSLEKTAPDEEEAKTRILGFAKQEQTAALAACREAHQNLAGCIATKYTSMASSLSALGFAARKSLEEAIEKDCRAQQGECLEAPLGEVKCVELKTNEPKEAEKGEKVEKGGKDKKK